MADLIDRQMAIQKMRDLYSEDLDAYGVEIPEMFDCDRAIEALQNLPSAEPDIIYCKDCKRHNISVEDTWDQYKKWCPLVAYRGKAQGHEFDYQFCVCGERRTDG